MTTLQDKLDNIYQTKLEIKSAIGTDSDVFSEYPAMIRSMAGGGVSYSYLDERLSYYVETEDLNTTLSYYVETSDLESMGYITIEDVPQVDLSSYVTYTYLESKEYLTEIPNTYATYAAISEMSYATESYVTNAISSIPGVDLSSYVTYTYLESKEYITINDVPTIDTSSYVTYTYLESKEYITINDVPTIDTSSYVTYTYLESKQYATESYVSDAINNIPGVDLSSYVTYTYLESKEYATESYVSDAISNIPGVDLSSYVTYTYLESKQYLTEIPATYATYAAIEAMGYVTSNDLPVINENIIPKENNTYNLGTSSNQFAYTYTNNLILGSYNITDLINGMFSYDTTTGTLTITTIS